MIYVANTDYESVLFHNRPSLKMTRELEFLSLWLVDSIKNSVDYSDDYLERILKHTGRRPHLFPKAHKTVNWWGSLTHLELERELNSKETSKKLSHTIGEEAGVILSSLSELSLLDTHKTYLFKSFDGVSGKGIKLLHQLKENDFPLLAEVLHKRLIDFSSYSFENGPRIYYQNFISPQFSYKGSFFDLENAQNLMELDFVKAHQHLPWDTYLKQVNLVEAFVRSKGKGGFSVDSYIHEEGIRTLCEINYRRTMGATAFEIAKLFSNKRFHFFTILKVSGDYQDLLEKCESEDILLLSHELTYFSYFLISGDKKEEVSKKIKTLELISGTSLAVDI